MTATVETTEQDVSVSPSPRESPKDPRDMTETIERILSSSCRPRSLALAKHGREWHCYGKRVVPQDDKGGLFKELELRG